MVADWRMVSAGLAGVTLARAVVLWFGVPDKPRAGKESPGRAAGRGLRA